VSINLSEVVPFGRSLAEYQAMFNLSPSEQRQWRILDCGGGPASFNGELTAQGGQVISIDPLYQFSVAQIEQRFFACLDDIIAQVDATPDNWCWGFHRDSADLRQNRIAAMASFTADFDLGSQQGRYLQGSLPQLPFADNSFDLALCSHLLFLYSGMLSPEFHRQAVSELCRVARELRIFPLRTLNAQPSRDVEPVCRMLQSQGLQPEIVQVKYELQKGGNEMLRVLTHHSTA
jgi:hypothetical protein